MQYDINDWLKFRGGGVLVPLGRSTSTTRQPLGPTAPLAGGPRRACAAADGGLGRARRRLPRRLPAGEQSLLNYQAYVVNGVILDTEFEQVARHPRGRPR